MTLASLRALHAIIGDAIADIERTYADAEDDDADTSLPSPPAPSSPAAPADPFGPGCYNTSYVSPPPSPCVPRAPRVCRASPLEFPALDEPYDPTSSSEALTSHPVVTAAAARIVAAAGQLSASVQQPFLTLCDASMGYHLPACMRVLEATHTVELLRDSGPDGMPIDLIAQHTGTDSGKLCHVLRLLATHHILRETSPNVFALNRISGLMDSGKPWRDIADSPDDKYEGTNGISAFVGMCTDELFKAAAYLTEAYVLDPRTRHSREPTHAPFNFAFGTRHGFFAWLEGEGPQLKGQGKQREPDFQDTEEGEGRAWGRAAEGGVRNRARLARFGQAMLGTGSWEVPGAILTGFNWASLAPGSIIVDVGGGIGSTTMLLAESSVCQQGLTFIIQDRAVVVDMGIKAWRNMRPALLDSGTVTLAVHDFFEAQPVRNAAVFLLRVILHDWPDAFARRILLRLRNAATSTTHLVLADYVLPLACADNFGNNKSEEGVEGAEHHLGTAPLLANLGKASANAYWMDMTMQVTFNGQERTLRETVVLAASAGWRVTRVTRAPGSLFGHIVAVPAPIPADAADVLEAASTASRAQPPSRASTPVLGSRCGTPTFGSRMDLPSMGATLVRFGGGVARRRVPPAIPPKPPGARRKPSPLTLRSASGPTPGPTPPGSAGLPRTATPGSPHSPQLGPPPPPTPRATQPKHVSSPRAPLMSPRAAAPPPLPHATPLSPRTVVPSPRMVQTPRAPPLSPRVIMPRRLSYAPPPTRRARAGSVAGPLGLGIQGPGAQGLAALTEGMGPLAENTGVSVLAAAAKIEQGLPRWG